MIRPQIPKKTAHRQRHIVFVSSMPHRLFPMCKKMRDGLMEKLNDCSFSFYQGV